MIAVQAYIVAAKTATLLFGGAVTYFAAKAYLRTRSPALRALAVGLGLVTVGTLLAGALHQVGWLGLAPGVAVQSSFTAVGFLVLAYSLYVRTADDDEQTDSGVPR